MKIIRYILFLITIFSAGFVQADDSSEIVMIRDVQRGFSEPQYIKTIFRPFKKVDGYKLYAWSRPDFFPISSEKQGSVILSAMEKFFVKNKIRINLIYPPKDFDKIVYDFEYNDHNLNKGKYIMDNVEAIMGMYYEDIPYSRQKYLYPAFFENKFYIITSRAAELDLNKKEDLKKYKGIYTEKEYISKYILKEFKEIGMKTAPNLEEAYRELLTGKVDYIVASYYPSLIEAYKLGIKNYILFSKDEVWKAAMFFRIAPGEEEKIEIQKLKKFLKSREYKNARDQALDKMVQIYEENTNGIVPPTYITEIPKKDIIENSEKEKSTENLGSPIMNIQEEQLIPTLEDATAQKPVENNLNIEK